MKTRGSYSKRNFFEGKLQVRSVAVLSWFPIGKALTVGRQLQGSWMDHSTSQSPVQPVRIRVPILRMLAQRFPRRWDWNHKACSILISWFQDSRVKGHVELNIQGHFLRMKLEKHPVLHVRKDVRTLGGVWHSMTKLKSVSSHIYPQKDAECHIRIISVPCVSPSHGWHGKLRCSCSSPWGFWPRLRCCKHTGSCCSERALDTRWRYMNQHVFLDENENYKIIKQHESSNHQQSFQSICVQSHHTLIVESSQIKMNHHMMGEVVRLFQARNSIVLPLQGSWKMGTSQNWAMPPLRGLFLSREAVSKRPLGKANHRLE